MIVDLCHLITIQSYVCILNSAGEVSCSFSNS